jgi:DNA-directed RNA polymerase I, II, and III subunit RPABC3
MAESSLLEETFTITSIDNARYDRVSRLSCTSTDSTLSMTLDINHELFHVTEGEHIQVVLTTTLSLDGAPKEGAETAWRNVGRAGHATLADMFDYVCYGRQYKFEDGDNETA